MITNPILRGFNPDASAVRVDDDYYIAVSTFEWYPGISIYHSRDLANWYLVSCPIKEMDFSGDDNSAGLWAPHLSWSDGRFWLAITEVRSRGTFKDTNNYLSSCETIDGEWTRPIFINASGFDPALFHNEDGRKYFLNMLWDYRPGHTSFSGIVMQEFDPVLQQLIGHRRLIFTGTTLGVTEGPQIFKRNGFYYLITAEGGTGYMHAATVARSRDLWGPYETLPDGPLITSVGAPELPLQKSGHICFLELGDEWYITHICARPLAEMGNCVLGRETSLQKIEWYEDWPRLAQGGNRPKLVVDSPVLYANAEQVGDLSKVWQFDEFVLPLDFLSLRVPLGNSASLAERPGWLRLYGRESIISNFDQTLVAARWRSFRFRVETALDFQPKSFQQLAGLALFYNTENFFYAYKCGGDSDDQSVLNLMVCEHGKATFAAEDIPVGNGLLYLAAEVNGDQAQFFYSKDQLEWVRLGNTLPADHLSDDHIEKSKLVFTGAMFALACQDLDRRTAYADFDYLLYKELPTNES